MRARLLVIAVFVSASTVPGILAFSAGVIPGGISFAGASKKASGEFRVTTLGWPKQALGLSASDESVVWEQRGSDRSSTGLWVYDVPSQRPFRMLTARQVGRDAGRWSMSHGVVAWTARVPGKGHRAQRVLAYDVDSGRLFTVTSRGALPCVWGDDIVWAASRDRGGRTRYALMGLNSLTDDRYAYQSPGRVRGIAAFGRWTAWLCEQGGGTAVWVMNRRYTTRSQLDRNATALAIDGQRAVWAAVGEDGETTVTAWNLRSNVSTEIHRVRAEVGSLAVASNVAVWAQDTGDGDIWAYDFDRRRAYAVCDDDAEQTSPVLVGRTVFWADHRSGQWELYGRSLQP